MWIPTVATCATVTQLSDRRRRRTGRRFRDDRAATRRWYSLCRRAQRGSCDSASRTRMRSLRNWQLRRGSRAVRATRRTASSWRFTPIAPGIKCLEADPARRWQSAAELERELRVPGTQRRTLYAAAAGALLTWRFGGPHRPVATAASKFAAIATTECTSLM